MLVSVSDISRRHIPNAVVALGTGWAVLSLWFSAEPGLALFEKGVIGGGVALGLAMPGYLACRLGAGDVKVAAVIGLWGGVGVVLGAVAAAGVLSLLWYAVAPRRAAPDGVRVQSAVRLPYGAFLAIGAAATMAAGL